MIPLSQATKKTPYLIRELKGNEESNRFLKNIGCTIGEEIVIIKKIANNYIVHIKDGRFGIDQRFAQKIMVEKV